MLLRYVDPLGVALCDGQPICSLPLSEFIHMYVIRCAHWEQVLPNLNGSTSRHPKFYMVLCRMRPQRDTDCKILCKITVSKSERKCFNTVFTPSTQKSPSCDLVLQWNYSCMYLYIIFLVSNYCISAQFCIC